MESISAKTTVLFVYPDVTNNPGILKKLRQKLSVLQEMDRFDLRLLIFGRDPQGKAVAEFKFLRSEYLTIPKYEGNTLLRQPLFWPLMLNLGEKHALSRIAERVNQLSPDVLIMRDFRATKEGNRVFAQLNAKKKVLEINTNLEAEAKMLYQRDVSNRWNYLQWQAEKRRKAELLNEVDGFIGVSTELIDLYQAKCVKQKPAVLCANGCIPANVPLASIPVQKEMIRAVFLAGAGDSFYKIERFLKSLEEYKGETMFQVNVVGMERRNIVRDNYKVTFAPTAYGAALDQCLNDVHFGISTMGLHQKNMNEGSTLKVREYVSRGIPVLLGYTDSDISDDAPFVFRVPNSEAPIKVNEVVEWAKAMPISLEFRNDIRSYAIQHLSYQAKMRDISEWIQNELS